VDLTPAVVTINFLMSDLTWENGPIRQIAGTHAVAGRPPSPADEPEWMRLSTLVGATACSGVFRDNRTWHGATPNLSREIRAMPNVEYLAPWVPAETIKKTMPHEIWKALSPHAQKISRYVKADPGSVPQGAGTMSPLTNLRRAAAGKPEAPADYPRGPI
jgi:ectoine hydroxylase-related dioxygenase (phytanoyl-CoA dioxygenase family)